MDKHQTDLQYIKDNLDIDFEVTPRATVLQIMQDHQLPTTSWVVTCLDVEYPNLQDQYIKQTKDLVCYHGFIGDCHYCKWGTD